jgi:hypothetical protein
MQAVCRPAVVPQVQVQAQYVPGCVSSSEDAASRQSL